jgi:hypothetical protein
VRRDGESDQASEVVVAFVLRCVVVIVETTAPRIVAEELDCRRKCPAAGLRWMYLRAVPGSLVRAHVAGWWWWWRHNVGVGLIE